ncbi:MAG: hypothetical protein ABFS56_15055 [Pseudomonadota bacterium]
MPIHRMVKQRDEVGVWQTEPFQFAGGVGAMTNYDGTIYMRARYYH